MSVQSLDEVKKFINGVGFPIVVCLILFYFNLQLVEKQTAALENMTMAISGNSQEVMVTRQTVMENGKLIAMLVTENKRECRP